MSTPTAQCPSGTKTGTCESDGLKDLKMAMSSGDRAQW